MISFSRGSFQSFRLCCPGKGRSLQDRSFPLVYYQQHVLTHPMKTALDPEAEFFDEIQTKVFFKVFFRLAIYSHLYSFAFRFIFFQTHTAYGLRNLYKNLKSGTLKIMHRNLNEIVRSLILLQGRYPAKQH
jgi:hypothetical protein